jgi:hypothetical protein
MERVLELSLLGGNLALSVLSFLFVCEVTSLVVTSIGALLSP